MFPSDIHQKLDQPTPQWIHSPLYIRRFQYFSSSLYHPTDIHQDDINVFSINIVSIHDSKRRLVISSVTQSHHDLGDR